MDLDDVVLDPAPPPTRQARLGAPLRQVGARMPWRATLREFAVIVTGVLAALGAQAWWQGREQHGRERDYLRQLLSDTRENERRLSSAIAEDSAAGEDARRVATALYGGGPLPPADTLVKWFQGHTFAASEFQPLTGSYTALLASGDVRIIANDSLRAQLVAYAAALESERDKLRFFFEQGFSDPGRIARALPFLRRSFIQTDAPMRNDTLDLERLRRDPDVAGVIFAIQVANANRISHLRYLRSISGDLRRALEAEPLVSAGRAAHPSAR